MPKDYYSILGVSLEASAEEIQTAFEKLSAQLGHGWQAEEQLIAVEEAYAVLSDPSSRTTYNRFYKIFEEGTRSFDGLDAVRMDGAGTLPGLKPESVATTAQDWKEIIDQEGGDRDELDSPILNNLVNALQSAILNLINNQSEPRIFEGGSDHHLDDVHIYLDLKLKAGEKGTKFLNYYGYIQCSDCNGQGSWHGHPLVACLACANLEEKRSCLVCAGLGKYPSKNCPRCKGEGRVMARRQIEVKISKNIQHQAMIRVAGGGHQGFRGLRKGDLFIEVFLNNTEKR